MRLSIVSLGIACLLVAPPSPAGVAHRAAFHRGDGGVARTHGTRTSGPDDRHAWHAGGTTRDGAGAFSHARASGASGPDRRIAAGHRFTMDGDGTISRQGGVAAQGTNGGTMRGGRSVQRNPDGSIQADHVVSGQGAAGGSFSKGGTRTRGADGERMASRQAQASGAEGATKAAPPAPTARSTMSARSPASTATPTQARPASRPARASATAAPAPTRRAGPSSAGKPRERMR